MLFTVYQTFSIILAASDSGAESPGHDKGNENGRGESTESTGDKVSGMESDANPGSIESGIDEARGCRLTNIAPWTHTPISHPVHGIKKQLESKDGRMTSKRADGNGHSRQTAWLRASGSPTCGSPHHAAIPLIHGCQYDSHPSMKYKTTFADGIYAYVGPKPLETN